MANGEWTWTLNWSVIREDIVVGSCPMSTKDIDRVCKEAGVTALLSVQADLCRAAFNIDWEAHIRHAKKRGFLLVNAPMRDFDPPEQRRRLPDAVRCLYRLLSRGDTVYVHCTAGINRSPLTVLGYLTFIEGMPPDDAYALIKAARPEAEPYWEAYHGCREDLVNLCRDAIERRAWDLSKVEPQSAPESHWIRAEKEIIRDVFLATASAPDSRLDPSRS
jgi:predicted fused transcriptional regulator/phosphomethylpyrimidine kinase